MSPGVSPGMKLVLFDLDGTLLATDSDHAFGEFLVRIGWAHATEFRRRNDEFYLQYQAGRLDIDAYIDFATAPWRTRDGAALARISEAFIEQAIRPALHDSALELVRQHQQAGDVVAIVTATNEFITRPIADLFGVRDLIATELARDAGGQVSGRILGTASFREGKITRLDQWLASRQQVRQRAAGRGGHVVLQVDELQGAATHRIRSWDEPQRHGRFRAGVDCGN